MKSKVSITLENLYNQFATFFFGTVSLLILLLYGNALSKDSNLNFLLQVLPLTFFACYSFNVISFITYYSAKASKTLREFYSARPQHFTGIVVFLFLMSVLVGGYFTLGLQKLIETVVSTVLLAALGAVGWFLKKIIEPKLKKKLR